MLDRVVTFQTFHRGLLLLTGMAALFVLVEVARFLPVTGDNMHPEAANMVIAAQWARGHALYTDFRQPPYLLAAFPPLWYAVLAVAARLGLGDLDALTLFGRALSVASLLGVAGLGYLWHRRLGVDRGLAALTPAFFLAFPVLMPWVVTARPDFPMLMLGALALVIAAFGTGVLAVVLAAGAAAAGFLVKHSALAVPAAVVLWLLSARRARHAILFAGVWLLVAGGTLAVGDVMTGGFLRLNLSGPQFGHFSPGHAHQVLLRLLTPPGNGFALALLAFGGFGFLHAWQGDQRERLLGFYFVTSLVLAVGGSALAGANVNHYLEPGLAWALLAPVGVRRLGRDWRPGAGAGGLAAVVVLVLLLPSLDIQRWNMLGAEPPDYRRLADLVRERRVLTDLPYVGARSRAPELLDSVPLAYLERVGVWSAHALVGAVEAREYDLVILHLTLEDPRWAAARYPTVGPPLRAAIARNYAFCFETDSNYVYAPIAGGGSNAAAACPDQKE